MKDTRLNMAVVAVSLLFVAGCGPAPTAPGGVAATGTVTYSENGTAYTASAGLTTAYATYNNDYKILQVTGLIQSVQVTGLIQSDFRLIQLSTTGLASPGTAPLGAPYVYGAVSGFLVYSDSAGTPRQVRQFCTNTTFIGTTTLTKLDTVAKLVSGTFSGKLKQLYSNGATDSVTITAGSFTDVPIK